MEIFICLISLVVVYFLALYLVVHWSVRKFEGLPQFEKVVKKKLDNPLWYQLFIQLPVQYFYDLIHRDPNIFKPQGIIIFEGPQGSGKTMSLMHYATQLKYLYPLAKILSNTAFTLSNLDLKHWKQLCNYSNGEHGVICIIDELQNWFSCKDSKNFPPEMLAVVTQNRKNRRIILGTAQNFYMLAKDIRTQCSEVRKTITLFGCFCVVVKLKPVFNSAGDVEKYKYRGFYTYVQTKELRDSYDTYSVIERLSESGFQNREVVKASA